MEGGKGEWLRVKEGEGKGGIKVRGSTFEKAKKR